MSDQEAWRRGAQKFADKHGHCAVTTKRFGYPCPHSWGEGWKCHDCKMDAVPVLASWCCPCSVRDIERAHNHTCHCGISWTVPDPGYPLRTYSIGYEIRSWCQDWLTERYGGDPIATGPLDVFSLLDHHKRMVSR